MCSRPFGPKSIKRNAIFLIKFSNFTDENCIYIANDLKNQNNQSRYGVNDTTEVKYRINLNKHRSAC